MQLYSVDALSATSVALSQEADNDGTVFTHENKPTVTHLLIELRNEDSGKNWETISCQKPRTKYRFWG